MSTPATLRKNQAASFNHSSNKKLFFATAAVSFLIGATVGAGGLSILSHVADSPSKVLSKTLQACQDENSSVEKLSAADYGAIEYEQTFNPDSTPILDCIGSETKMPTSVRTAIDLAAEHADQKESASWDGLKATWVYYSAKNDLQTNLLIEVAR